MGHINDTTCNAARERGKHLILEDRCSIKVFRKLKYSLRKIAAVLNRSPSTIMYELWRGIGECNRNKGRFPEYSAKRGKKRYEDNRKNCHRDYKISADNPLVVWATQKIKTDNRSIDACVGYARLHELFPAEVSSAPRASTMRCGVI